MYLKNTKCAVQLGLIEDLRYGIKRQNQHTLKKENVWSTMTLVLSLEKNYALNFVWLK